MAEDLAGQPFLDVVVEDTHSCYLGDRTHWHDWGFGCGSCPACQLRAQGYATFMGRRTKN
jgi:7-cyano-7-deazaguanine synthase